MSLYYLWSSCRLPLLMVSCTLEGFLKPSSQCSYVLFVFCNYSCIINVLNKLKHFLPLKNLFELILYDINQKCSLLHWVISLANLPSTDTGSLYQQHKSWPAIALLNSPLVNNTCIWFWNIPFHHKDSSITLQVLKAYSIMYFCFIWVGIQLLKVFIITYLHVL